jgi:thioredoxin 1
MLTMNKKFLLITSIFVSSLMLLKFNYASTTSPVPSTKSDFIAPLVPPNDEGKVIVLDEAQFKEKVWNYEENPEKWVFKGDLPAVVDFYADWCGPCKRIAPIMEKLAKEYAGQINIYKVNTDHNRELSSVFGIRSIPAILYIPKEGQPAMEAGAKQEAAYRQIFEEFVLAKKKEEKETNNE